MGGRTFDAVAYGAVGGHYVRVWEAVVVHLSRLMGPVTCNVRTRSPCGNYVIRPIAKNIEY